MFRSITKRVIHKSFLLGFVFFFCFISRGLTQEGLLRELALKEMIYITGATLVSLPFEESPSPTMVYDKRFFREFGFNNIRDFLEYLPSIYLIQDVNERVIAWRGLYTTSSNTFLFLEDGQRLDIPSFGSFLLDGSYPLLDISHLEMVSGPSSVLYGTNAFSGVFQVSREPTSKVSFYGSLGEFENKMSSLSLNLPNIYSLIHYADLPGDTYYNTPIHPRRDNLAFLLRTHLKDLDFNLYYFRNQYETPRSQRGTPLSSQDKEPFGSEEDGKLLVSNLKKVFFFGDFKITLIPSVTYFTVRTPQVRNTHREPPFTALDIKLQNERYNLLTYLETQLYQGNFLFGIDATLLRHREYKSKMYNGSSILSRLPKEKEENLAFFVQYILPIKNFQIHLGTRYDYFSLWGSNLSPRIALNYALTPKLTFQINYSSAFNTPPYFYTKANPALGYGSTTKLKPEILKNYSLHLLYHDQKVTSRLTLFQNLLKDKIGYNSLQRVYVNLEKLKTLGIEGELIYKTPELLAFLNYSWLSVQKGKDLPMVYKEEYIYAIPKWMVKGGISLPFSPLPNLTLAPSFRWYGKSYYRTQMIDGYALWDLNLLFSKENLKVNFKIENIFDKHYRRAGNLPPIPWEGRKVTLGLKLDF